MSRKTRKLIWSAPLVAVLAVAGALAIFAAQMPGTALAHDPPGVVGNLMGEADGQNQIDLSWDVPAIGGTPTSYRIDRSMNGNTWMTHKTGHTMTEYSDTGLKPGMSYYYRVFAVNSAGTGPVSQDYQVQTDAATAPSEVISLVATAMGQNQVNLSWMAPAKLGGKPITKYSIHFAPAGTDLPAQAQTSDTATDPAGVIEVEAEDGTAYEHEMLTANTRYRYIVYAHNGPAATDKSTMSSDVAAATTAPLVKPGAPTGVTAVQTGARDFTLYWFAPTETGGTAVISYEVHASYNGGPFAEEAGITWTDLAGTSADSGAHTVDADTGGADAVPITRVQYRVYAVTREAADGPPAITELKSTGYGQSQQMTIVADANRASLIPAPPVIATGTQVTRSPKGDVNLEWDAPDIDSDDNDLTNNNAPDSIGGYRIDVSDDGVNWRRLINHTRKTATEYQYVDPERKDRHYRVFAWHAQYLGPAQTTVAVSALETGNPVAPGHVTGFTATAVGPTQIDLAWKAPANDGGAPIVRYQIDGVRQAADGTFVAFAADQSAADADDSLMYATSETTGYMHKELNAGETWQYRVLTVTDDGSDGDNIRTATAANAETRRATTHQADLPEAPEGLTAEDAKNSSVTDDPTARGVLLQWNAPNPPDGAMIDGYRIQRKKGDAAWETLVMDTNNTFTDYTDRLPPAAGELRAYRVAALSGTKVGDYSDEVYYPHNLTMPGKPGLTAMPNSAMPGTKVDLTWTAPTMMADLVDGYIIERAYGDVMFLNPVMVDDKYTVVAHPNYAFSDHMEWWETLDCAGMLKAVGSSADPTMDSEDKAMYCAHYAMTGPTADMTFPAAKQIADGSAVDMKIEMYFDKRYKVIADASTMTHTDTVMENMAYSYRVRATHGMTAGMWSDTQRVMTTTDNMAPVAGPDLTATVTAGETTMVQSTISDPDADDTLTWDTMTSSTAPEIATATVDATTGRVTITGVAAGPATITVTAMDAAGASATQDIMVTVEAANNAPVPATDPGDVLPAEVSLMVGGDDTVITLTDSFTDPDGDMLTYSAMSDMEMYATATVSDDGTMLTIAAVAAGMATVTVTAYDGNGGSATHDIAVTVTSGMPIRPTITSVSPLLNSIGVVWDPASIQNAEAIKVALFDLDANGDIFRLAMGYDGNVRTINPASDAAADAAHTFTNVPAGTYKVGVANYANGVHRSIVSGAVTVSAP